MRKLVAFGLAAALAGGAAPAQAVWTFDTPQNVCAGIDVCVNFQLAQGASSWTLTATVNGTYSGLFHELGLYSLDGSAAYTPTSIDVVPAGWSELINPPDGGISALAPLSAGKIFEFGTTKPGGPGYYQVAITFSPPPDPLTDGTLVAIAHVGSIGTGSCSVKFGSWDYALEPDGGYESCGSSVPEPISLVLLGSGLLGLGGLRMRRRNRK